MKESKLDERKGDVFLPELVYPPSRNSAIEFSGAVCPILGYAPVRWFLPDPWNIFPFEAIFN